MRRGRQTGWICLNSSHFRTGRDSPTTHRPTKTNMDLVSDESSLKGHLSLILWYVVLGSYGGTQIICQNIDRGIFSSSHALCFVCQRWCEPHTVRCRWGACKAKTWILWESRCDNLARLMIIIVIISKQCS